MSRSPLSSTPSSASWSLSVELSCSSTSSYRSFFFKTRLRFLLVLFLFPYTPPFTSPCVSSLQRVCVRVYTLDSRFRSNRATWVKPIWATHSIMWDTRFIITTFYRYRVITGCSRIWSNCSDACITRCAIFSASCKDGCEPYTRLSSIIGVTFTSSIFHRLIITLRQEFARTEDRYMYIRYTWNECLLSTLLLTVIVIPPSRWCFFALISPCITVVWFHLHIGFITAVRESASRMLMVVDVRRDEMYSYASLHPHYIFVFLSLHIYESSAFLLAGFPKPTQISELLGFSEGDFLPCTIPRKYL